MECGKSMSTLQRLIKNFLNKPPSLPIKLNDKCHLIIDGSYFKPDFCLLNYFDNDLKYLQCCSITTHENLTAFVDDLIYLKESGLKILSITSDGHRALLKAVKIVFPGIIHQRCVIHIQRMALIYLTRNPKLKAGIELRIIVLHLHEVSTHREKEIWIIHFQNWYKRYHKFLLEKSVNPITGRSWYQHKMLRRVRSLIQNALPNMFHYLDDPDIPKSSNGLESRFSYMKNDLRIHRGLSEENRKNFLLWYVYFKYK